jgi:hypothetical protein
MVHCGYEGTAVEDTVRNPLKALKVWLGGIETEAPMQPEIPLGKQRSAVYSFEDFVAEAVASRPSVEKSSKVSGSEAAE